MGDGRDPQWGDAHRPGSCGLYADHVLFRGVPGLGEQLRCRSDVCRALRPWTGGRAFRYGEHDGAGGPVRDEPESFPDRSRGRVLPGGSGLSAPHPALDQAVCGEFELRGCCTRNSPLIHNKFDLLTLTELQKSDTMLDRKRLFDSHLQGGVYR